MDLLKDLYEGLKRLTAEEETLVDINEWQIMSTTVEDTFLKDLVPVVLHSQRIALLQKQERNNDISHPNGDTSLEPELDESNCGDLSKDTSLSDGLGMDTNNNHLLLVEDARNILIMYTAMHSSTMLDNNHVKHSEPLLPLWILCDGQDPERTSLIGCEPARANATQSVDDSPFIITTVTSEGPITSKSDIPSLHQVLLESHEEGASKHIMCHGFAQYEVVSQLSADTTMAEVSDSTFIAVECSWSPVKKIMETPQDATCKVAIRAVPGDMRNTPLAVYQELCTLVTFADSLETGEVSWVIREKTRPIQDLINSFLEDMMEGPVRTKKVAEESEDFDSQLCWKSAFDRSDLDFTEKLWNILRTNATCYQDIVTAFTLVTNELNRGQIQPMVHSNNQTTLAREIRTLYQDPAHMLSLDPSPMVLLVELGIDKLQRDYTSFFLAQKLTSLHFLEWFIPSVELLTPCELVTRLQSLHCILEVSRLASGSLSLPTNNILTLIRNALDYYKNNSPDTPHTFVLPVEQTSVLHLYNNQLPSVWRLSTQCGGRGEKTSSVYQLSSKPKLSETCSHYAPEMTMEVGADDQESFQYFVTCLRRRVERLTPCFTSPIDLQDN